jgi:hypothetical protein
MMAAMRSSVIKSFPLEEAVKTLKPLDLRLLGLSEVMD